LILFRGLLAGFISAYPFRRNVCDRYSAVVLQGDDFVGVEAIFTQDRFGVLAVQRRAARCGRY
jgi:hypothetical protein